MLLKYLFLNLKGICREREETKRNVLSTELVPKWLQWQGLGKAETRIQALHGVSHGMAGAQARRPSSTASPATLVGNGIRSVAIGTQIMTHRDVDIMNSSLSTCVTILVHTNIPS